MNVAGVCSGISAPSVAWADLGWNWVFESEIEAFPSAVLKHHHPDVPNLGDMNEYRTWPSAALDLLIGGTPCQSFSVAGLRAGLDDPRGNLALVFIGLVERYKPRWVIWENVPGVLSSGEGEDLQAFIDGMAGVGYFGAWRVLDAQYFGLAQRRRRVFAVFCAGDWRPAAAVLLEPESLRWDPAPSREKGKGIAGTLGGSSQSGGFRTTDPDNSGAFIPEVFATLDAHDHSKWDSKQWVDQGKAIVCLSSGQANAEVGVDQCPTLNCLHEAPVVAFKASHFTRGKDGAPSEIAPPLSADADKGDQDTLICFPANLSGTQHASTENLSPALGAKKPTAVASTAVRRLTPRECERLQGFPDDYTQIPWKGKPAEQCPDGPRYKALGNSMATPVVRWIGERIRLFEATLEPAPQTRSSPGSAKG